jgi:hypothetical protein
MRYFPGSIVIKNISSADYIIVELGGELLAPNETLDLLNNNGNEYKDYKTAKYVCESLESADLYKDIKNGIIQVIQDLPPLDR